MKAIVFVLIFSFLISFAGCTTDNPSNNQENENSEGVEVLDAAIEKELAAGESFDIAVEKNLGENYYLTVKYSSVRLKSRTSPECITARPFRTIPYKAEIRTRTRVKSSIMFKRIRKYM